MNIAKNLTLVFCVSACSLVFAVPLIADEKPATPSTTTAAPGIEDRIPWTTSRITGSPEPPRPYRVERVFPGLQFKSPVGLTSAPGTERMFVFELAGKVYSFENRAETKQMDLAIDLRKHIEGVGSVYGMEFHPDFANNRYCYICYVIGSNIPDGTHVSRFTVSKTEPPVIDPASEKSIITWPSGGHNGGCLKFGHDGFLYISTGDGTGPNPPDILKTGQDVSDLLSSVLRIDVDHEEAGNAYRIPPDNPFINLKGARPEIWAFGFRNPWKMNFDRKTGRLWLGDVGWELWELVYHVRSGGNYGWSAMEGPQPVDTENPRGPTPILPPTVPHPHSEAASITGGHVYYGDRLPELTGSYIYGDYETGKIWSLRYDGEKVTSHNEIADTTMKLVAFGIDHDDELYLVGHTDGMIYRLIRNSVIDSAAEFPRKLSDTGLFASIAELTPAAGVIAYSTNAEPWQDGARSERLLALPGKTTITTAANPWTFPKDAVLAKTISLPMQQGNPNSNRRLETQILHFDGEAWQGYTYRWNDEQTDAELLGAEGGEQTLSIEDPTSPGGIRKQTWKFASRAECMRCHNPWSGNVLAFNVPQLNRDHDYHKRTANQLRTFAHVGLLDKDLSVGKDVPQLAEPRDEHADLNARARAYLQVNCAHCHRMHAGSSVLSKMRYDLELEKTTMIDERPTQGTFGLQAARVITPGNPFRSVLWYRMSKLGRGRMPHIGSEVVDTAGAELIHRWISSLPSTTDKDVDVSPLAANSKIVTTLTSDESPPDARTAAIDEWLSTTSGALGALWAVDAEKLTPAARQQIIERGIAHADSTVRDLFERFVPEDQRVKRLGSVIKPEQILSLPGNAESGKHLFFKAAGVQCRNCHRIGETGNELGPNLSELAKTYTAAQLLEGILQPSKKIEPKYVSYLLETKQGKVHTGLIVKKTDDEVVLKDAANKEIHVGKEDVELLAPQQKSLMPELLLRDMTAQEVADLLKFLTSLKSVESGEQP